MKGQIGVGQAASASLLEHSVGDVCPCALACRSKVYDPGGLGVEKGEGLGDDIVTEGRGAGLVVDDAYLGALRGEARHGVNKVAAMRTAQPCHS